MSPLSVIACLFRLVAVLLEQRSRPALVLRLPGLALAPPDFACKNLGGFPFVLGEEFRPGSVGARLVDREVRTDLVLEAQLPGVGLRRMQFPEALVSHGQGW